MDQLINKISHSCYHIKARQMSTQIITNWLKLKPYIKV